MRDVLGLNTKKSLSYLFIFIINPVLVYYAFEARMYSLFALLTTLSFYSFFTKRWKLYIFSLVLSLYTNYFSVIVLIVQGALVFYSDSTNKTRIALLKKIAIAVLFYIPWIVFVVFTKDVYQFASFWIKKPDIKTMFELLAIIYTGYEKGFFTFFDTKLIWMSGFYLFVLLMGWMNRKINVSLLIWAVVTPFSITLLSLLYPIFLPRYLIFSTVGFLFLLILIIDNLPYVPLRYIILFILVFSTFYYQALQVRYRQKTDVKKMVREIKILAKSGDLIYVADELDYFVMQYYLGEEKVFIYGKSFDEIKQWEGKILISKERITHLLPQYPRKAFLITNGGSFQILSSY